MLPCRGSTPVPLLNEAAIAINHDIDSLFYMNAKQSYPTLYQTLISIAAAVIILGAIRGAAPILNPIFFALVLSLIFGPLYLWLKQRLPSWLSLILMLVFIGFLFGGLFYIVSVSVTSMAARLATYVTQLESRLDDLETLLTQLGFGLESFDIRAVLNGKTISSVLGFFLGGLTNLLSNSSLILMLTLFFLAEGQYIIQRLHQSTSAENPFVNRLNTFGGSVVRQFGLRGIVNGVTGLAVAITLFLLGIDFPWLWGILVFFLSYIPYIGTIIAAIPPVLLGWAEFGLGRALVVVVAFTAANIFAENVLSPALLSRGLSISPTVVFVSFAFWTWLLGGVGAFLAMPLTFFLIVIFDSFPESRWLTDVMMIKAKPDAPT